MPQLLETLAIVTLVIIGAIIISFSAKFLGKTFEIITKLFLIIIVVLAILTALIYNDLQNLKEDIATGENTFIIREDSTTYSAIGFKPINSTEFDMSSFRYYTNEEVEMIDLTLDRKEELNITSNHTFILTPKILNKTYNLDVGVVLSQEDMLMIIMSSDPHDILARKLSVKNTISKEIIKKTYGDEARLKGFLSAALIINYFQDKDMSIADQIKKRDFQIIPETISFKIIRYLPSVAVN